MERNNLQYGVSAEGRFGTYYSPREGDREICFETNRKSGIDIISGHIFVPHNLIAPFATELIEMARVLGVTGEKKGNE